MKGLEPTAKAWVDAVQAEVPFMNRLSAATIALQRALLEIEVQKQKLRDFKQKVSDAVENVQTPVEIICPCTRKHVVAFNLLDHLITPKPKPDPLFDVLWDLGMAEDRAGIEFMANGINDALKARNLKIVEVKNDD